MTSSSSRASGVHTPLWRKVTAVFSLGSIVIVVGLVLGAIITMVALLAVFLVERAIS